MFSNFYDRNEVTILLFEKQKNTENEEIAADYYLIEQIQPQGGITFNDERYIQTGNSYECCLHIYELPEKVNDNWLKELTDIKDTVVTIDISSHDIYEIKKNINRSIQEQASRRGSATNWEEAYNAEKKANDMIQLFHEISKLKEVVKIIDIRIFISDREKEKLEEKISKLSKILESNKYRSAIFLNEAKNEWVSMYQTYTEQQKNPYSIFGQSIQGETLAHGNPFHFSSLEDPYGSYLGYTKCGGNVLFDEFTKTKTRLYYNSLVIGGMGSGKSTFLKKRFKDRAARGDFVRVFDITGEFSRLTKYYGGKIIKFGSSNTMLNPFEILRAGDNERGVYYKDMMREGKMSAQTFYDCKKSLTEKGVISSVEGQDDYDITLIGNDFTIYEKEDYEEGKVKYLSTTYHLFRDPYFRTLKPKQKLLVMDLLNIQMAGRPNGVNTYRIYRENFIKKYANIKQNDGTKSKGLLDITVRTLQKYFKLLKHYFSVSLKNGMYFFTLKSKFAKSGVSHTTENHITTQHLVKAACRRNKIKDPDAKEQEKIEKVLENREKEVLNQFVNISAVVQSMIEAINEKIPDPRKWNRRLKATLFIKKFNEAVS